MITKNVPALQVEGRQKGIKHSVYNAHNKYANNIAKKAVQKYQSNIFDY